MTDRELLELAAKAAGIEVRFADFHGRERGNIPFTVDRGLRWNPLTDDGDALRLAVKLGLSVNQVQSREQACCLSPFDVRGAYVEPYEGDPYAATRRAIVRAAARL